MFDPEKYFLIATRKVAIKSGLDEVEIRKRLCSGNTAFAGRSKWNGQPMVKEDDGRNIWHITFTEKPSPNRKKLIAYVVDVEAYGEDLMRNWANNYYSSMNAGR